MIKIKKGTAWSLVITIPGDCWSADRAVTLAEQEIRKKFREIEFVEAEDTEHSIEVGDVVVLHGVGGKLEGKTGEVTQAFQNDTYHVRVAEITPGGWHVTTIAVSSACITFDKEATEQLRHGGGVLFRKEGK